MAKWHKKLFFLSCILLLGLSSSSSKAYYDTHRHLVTQHTLKGKWTIINYWAEWCQACIEEIPALNQFYQHTVGQDILMYGVNYDPLLLSDLKKSIKKVGIVFPVLTEDPGMDWGLPPIEVIPATFILAPSGQVVKVVIGPSDEQTLTQLLHDLRQ